MSQQAEGKEQACGKRRLTPEFALACPGCPSDRRIASPSVLGEGLESGKDPSAPQDGVAVPGSFSLQFFLYQPNWSVHLSFLASLLSSRKKLSALGATEIQVSPLSGHKWGKQCYMRAASLQDRGKVSLKAPLISVNPGHENLILMIINLKSFWFWSKILL